MSEHEYLAASAEDGYSREHMDWVAAVADGSTILGLAEWLAFRDEHERAELHNEAWTLSHAREMEGR